MEDKEFDIWFTGFWEGEGHITRAIKFSKKRNQTWIRFSFGVAQSGNRGLKVLELIKYHYGGGRKDNLENKQIARDILSGKRDPFDFEVVCRVCNAHHYLTKLKGIKDRWEIRWKGNVEP